MAGTPLSVALGEEEDRTLRELRTASTVSQRVKDRAEAVRLVSKGWSVKAVAEYLGWSLGAVRGAIHRWEEGGLGGLWDAAKSGRPHCINEDDLQCVERWLREEERTYNAKQLAERLKQERDVEITADHLRQLLKSRGIHWKRTRSSHERLQDPEARKQKEGELKILQEMSDAGELSLYFCDESGCDPWSQTYYSYSSKGEQKRQEQTRRRGKRVNILGVFQPLVRFFYTLVVGSVTGETFIELMNEQARQAEIVLEAEGKIRVIVIDNASIHTCKEVRKCWEGWRSQGLFLFFLPPYCSEMNLIELEWLHLKRNELAGRMFSSGQELSQAIQAGFEARAQQNGHQTQVFCLQGI